MHTVYAMLLSNYKEMLPKTNTIEKFDFLKLIIRSQIQSTLVISTSVISNNR